jgi:Ser/Thr protein kinase RdoA (MazF antagonist)
VRGRTLDEGDDERLRQIGRLIGRMHAVGAAREAPHRPRFTVDFYARRPLEAIVAGKFIAEPLAGRYRDLVLRIADAVEPLLARAPVQRLHGDLHWGNTLWGADGPILVDFDDCCVGPPVQDLWLLARGDEAEVKHRREQLLAGYEVFREFDRAWLTLCEPLRALRIIHASGWIASRWDDQSFKTGFPAFGTDNYWMTEYEALFRIYEGLP